MIAVLLSGCGVFDGSEIHEAVLTLLALDQQGATCACLAPNKPHAVVNHLTHQPVPGATRNVLEESARIARGRVVDLAEAKPEDYAAAILPGGYGAAKNLCTFGADGPACTVDPDVERFLLALHAAGKPLGFLCIAPAVAAKVFGAKIAPRLTIGHDAGTAAGLEALGAKHVACDVAEIVVDETQRIVSTPAYMEARSIRDLLPGIDRLVAQVLAWTRR